MGDTHGGQLEQSTHMDRQPSATGMIASGTVDEEHVWALGKAADGRLQKWSLSKEEEPAFVGPPRPTRHDRRGDETAILHYHCGATSAGSPGAPGPDSPAGS